MSKSKGNSATASVPSETSSDAVRNYNNSLIIIISIRLGSRDHFYF